MNMRGEAFWSDVRLSYEANQKSIAAICKQFKITQSAIYYHARKDGWIMRRPMKAALHVRASDGGVRASDNSGRLGGLAEASGIKVSGFKTILSNDKLAACARRDGARAGSVSARLFEVLEVKLAEIEERIARGVRLTPGEIEREQRVIGNLIRNFDKLTEFNERRNRGGAEQNAKSKRAGGQGQPGRRFIET